MSPYSGYVAKAATPEVEDWEKRGTSSQRWTRYAIGAMQAVGQKYTDISKQTGKRVADQLEWRLASAGISVEFELQGSVPLDVHIKGVSDVDLLVITTNIVSYDSTGAHALPAATAAQLAEREQAEQDWQRRVLAFRAERERLAASTAPVSQADADHQAAQARLRAERFAPDEQAQLEASLPPAQPMLRQD